MAKSKRGRPPKKPIKDRIKTKAVNGSKTNEKIQKVSTTRKDKKQTNKLARQPKTWRELVRVTLKNGGTMQEASRLWRTGKIK